MLINCGIGAVLNLLETYGSRLATWEIDITNCGKDVTKLDASKDDFDVKNIYAEVPLKELLAARTIQCAHNRSLEDEEK